MCCKGGIGVAFYLTLNRYEQTILEYEQRPVEAGRVLLYGSSFFTNWGYDRSRDQLAAASGGALQVVNHGFGGATVDELLYYYDRMVRPCAPAAAVLRPGLNDLARGLSAEEVWFQTQRLLAWLKTDDPAIPVVVLSIFDTKRFADDPLAPAISHYNRLLAEGAGQFSHVSDLDLSPFFHSADGRLRDVFVEDGLHLTDAAYEEMAAYLAPKLVSLLDLSPQ